MLKLPKFELYLVRHGESEDNVLPDKMGQTAEVKLTEKGINQAKCLGAKIGHGDFGYFDCIYTSPYTRAFKTCKTVFPNRKDITVVNELREYDAGDWTGASRSEVITDEVKLNMGYLNMGFKPPSGESTNMVERRVSAWVEDNLLYWNWLPGTKYSENLNECFNKDIVKIICFTHGMTIKAFLHYVMGFDKSFTWKIDIDNTSVTKLTFGEVGWRLNFVNNTEHLGR